MKPYQEGSASTFSYVPWMFTHVQRLCWWCFTSRSTAAGTVPIWKRYLSSRKFDVPLILAELIMHRINRLKDELFPDNQSTKVTDVNSSRYEFDLYARRRLLSVSYLSEASSDTRTGEYVYLTQSIRGSSCGYRPHVRAKPSAMRNRSNGSNQIFYPTCCLLIGWFRKV